MHFPLSSIEANVRAFVSSVKQGSASANPSPVDDALASRKATKRSECAATVLWMYADLEGSQLSVW